MRLTQAEAERLAKRTGQKLPPPPHNRKPTNDATSDGEESFAFYWRLYAPDLPAPQRNAPVRAGRKWTVDFLLPGKVVVEIEGVSHRLTRYAADLAKYNWLSDQGYTLFRITPKLLRDDPATFVEQVKQAVLRRTNQRNERRSDSGE